MRGAVVGVWLVSIVGSVLLLAGGMQEHQSARGRAGAAESRRDALARHAAELASMRSALPEWTRRTAPESSLTPRVTSALTSAGLRPTALTNLTAGSPAAASNAASEVLAPRRAQVSMTLSGLGLQDLGRFLNEWRQREPDWVVTRIDATVEAGARVTPGQDLPLRIVLAMECLFVERSMGDTE